MRGIIERFRSISSRQKIVIAMSVVFISGFLVYLGSLNGQFVWDDEYLINQNRYVSSLKHLPKVFTEDFGRGGGQHYGFYRPVQSLVLMLGHALWGKSVLGYHLLSVLLHSFSAVLIIAVVYLLFSNITIAFITSLLFVVHPVNTEAVNYISGMGDPLGLFFVMLASLFYLIKDKLNKGLGYRILGLLCFALGLLSKEIVIMFPVFILLYQLAIKEELNFRKILPESLIILLYFIFRISLNSSANISANLLDNVLSRVPGMGVAFLSYIRLLIWPVGLHMDYGQKIFLWSDPMVLLGWFTILILLGIAFLLRKKAPVICLGIFWFFFMFLPVSNLVALPYYMSEHYLYMPSLGFYVIISYLIVNIKKHNWRYATYFLLTLGVTINISFTIKQHKYWSDPLSFFNNNLSYSPDNVRMLAERGKYYHKIGDAQSALADFKEVIKLDSKNSNAYNNIAAMLIEQSKHKQALPLFAKAVSLDNNNLDALNGLAYTNEILGRRAEALRIYQQVLAKDPEHIATLSNLAVFYARDNKLQKSNSLLLKIIEMDVYNAKAYFNLAVNYKRLADYDKLLELMHQASRRGIEFPPELQDKLEKHVL